MSEAKESVEVKYFNVSPDDPSSHFDYMEHGAGAMCADEDVQAGGDGFIYILLPAINEAGFEDSGALCVYRSGKPLDTDYPSWKITGDITKPETVTLHPSVHLRGTWHGWLRKGKLQSC